MVERIVLVKLHEEHLPRRTALAQESERRLAQVPGVREVTATVPADPASAGSWDLCLRLRFDDMAAVEAYVPHPTHQAYLAEVLTPAASFKKAWNFTLPV